MKANNSTRIWFIDTNILAHWVLGRGGVLDYLCRSFSLHPDFVSVYRARYQSSIAFLEEVLARRNQDLGDEIYVSSLAINELFSAIRDEVRSILFFKKGVPISRWRDSRNNPDISEEQYVAIYTLTLQAFDSLFEDHGITIIPEMSPLDEPNYWSVCSSILFLIKESKTQDATLLTTAIINRADFFITLDEALIRSANKKMKEEYGLDLLKPTKGAQILRSRSREG